MRFVHVSVPAGKLGAVTDALEEEGVDFVATEEVGGGEYTAVVSFPLPTEAVEPMLSSLREVGVSEEAFTVVLEAETVVSRRFEELSERFAAEESEERIAREELRARAADLSPETLNYVVLTVVSVVIATAGVLLDSASVVVGSMVIAPLIGPAMATSVGTVIDDSELFRSGVRKQLVGLALAVVAATAFALIVKTLRLVPPGLDPLSLAQAAERVTPGFLSLAVALGAGVAGAMSLRSGVSASLVGVAIAVALVPPVAVVGVGVAYGMWFMVVGSGVLALVNFLSINLAALVTFWYSGYRPERWFRLDEARSQTLTRIAALALAIAVLSVFLGGVTYGTYRNSVVGDTMTEEVRAVVADHPEVELLDVQVHESGNPLRPHPTGVVVTVGQTADGEPPGLAEELAAALSEFGDVEIEVRILEIERAETG